jgi:2-polyprenyl-3-methyl-5-hydroxy-6-metoxy-1,4-benzoquinol methylase
MTCCSSVCEAAGRQFGEKRAAEDLARYRAKGPGKTARLLLAGIEAAGAHRLPHDTPSVAVLDVGTGVGGIVCELLKRGATSGIAVDMSEAYIAAASEEASRQNLSGAIRFVHGDFVTVAPQLAAADLVTLDRVVCCYPDDRALIDESLRHARHSIALSYPRDAWYVKLVMSVENLLRRARGNPFRTFIHSPVVMQRRIEDAGFHLASRASTVAWCADVYIR